MAYGGVWVMSVRFAIKQLHAKILHVDAKMAEYRETSAPFQTTMIVKFESKGMVMFMRFSGLGGILYTWSCFMLYVVYVQ